MNICLSVTPARDRLSHCAVVAVVVSVCGVYRRTVLLVARLLTFQQWWATSSSHSVTSLCSAVMLHGTNITSLSVSVRPHVTLAYIEMVVRIVKLFFTVWCIAPPLSLLIAALRTGSSSTGTGIEVGQFSANISLLETVQDRAMVTTER